MLVLTRLVGQSVILITDDGKVIKIAVNYCRSDRVSLAIDAPRPGVEIWREEIFPGKDKIAVDKTK